MICWIYYCFVYCKLAMRSSCFVDILFFKTILVATVLKNVDIVKLKITHIYSSKIIDV